MVMQITRRGALRGFASAAALGIPMIVSSAKPQYVRIGRSVPLSGPLSQTVQQRIDGSRLFFEEVNRAGGVAGHRLDLLILDDGYDPVKLRHNIAQLDEQERVVAMFGTLGPALAENIEEFPLRKLPLIAATSHFSLRKPPHRYVFPMRAGFAEETAAIIRHITKIGFKRLAVVREEGTLGALGEAGYAAAMSEHKIKPAETITLKADGSDAQEGAQTLHRANCDRVVLAVTAPTFARMARVYASKDKLPTVFSISAIDTMHLLSELGHQALAMGVCQVVPSPMNFKFGVVREYAAAVKRTSGATATSDGLEGFLEAKLLVAGLHRAAQSGALSRASVLKAFDTFDVDLGDYHVTYSPGVRTGATFTDIAYLSEGGKLRS